MFEKSRTKAVQIAKDNGITILTILVIGLVWHMISIIFFSKSILLPPPIKALRAFGPLVRQKRFLNDIVVTLARVFLGFLIGSITGLLLGSITGRNKIAGVTLGRLITILRPIPHVALVPFFIIWFGIGDTSKILIVAWAVFIMIWVSTHVGVSHLNET